ncbi:MAG: GNAT family acetyltransferase [Myxococcota bacterium]|jgi:ribosomal protein S18 acetylase RimI-like enzyme
MQALTGPRTVSPDSLLIRPYLEADEETVVALWNEVFSEDPGRNEPRAVIRRKLAVQRELFLVGELHDRVVGTVIAGYDGYRGWVYHLAVHPDQQRNGFGRDLMSAAEASLKAMGCPKLNLQVRSSNEQVVAFYRRLDYSVEDRASLGKVIE